MVFNRGRGRRRRRRLVRDGDTYTLDELLDDTVELEERDEDENPPPERTRGEPWGWPDDEEHRERPIGWPGPENNPRYHNREDPGPFDGSWEPPVDGPEGRRDVTD
jgi:hypothetical protein